MGANSAGLARIDTCTDPRWSMRLLRGLSFLTTIRIRKGFPMTKSSSRSSGMTAVAVLNIVLGAFGSLSSLLLVLGGGVIAAVGGAAAADGAPEGSAAASMGGILMLVGLLSMACCVGLLASGIGVLKLAPWGRTLSIFCGGGLALINVIFILTSGFGLMTLAYVGYGIALVALFHQPQWKSAFCSSQSPADVIDLNKDQFRKAA
jgi:hypothetical protein